MAQKTINATENKELIDACQKGDTAKVRLCLQNGASPNTQEALWGWSVLNRAVDWGYKDIVTIPLHHGAEFDEKSIKLARSRGWPEIAELLSRYLVENEKNRQDQLLRNSSTENQTSEVSQVDTVPKKETKLGAVLTISVLACLWLIILLYGGIIPKIPGVSLLIVIAVLSALWTSFLIRRSPENLEQPPVTPGVEPSPETKEPEPVKISIETPKAEPSDTLLMGSNMANRKLGVVEKEILADLRAGKTDSELMNKNHISETTLEAIFKQLVEAELLTQDNLNIRKAIFQRTNLQPEPTKAETSGIEKPATIEERRREQPHEDTGPAVPDIYKNKYALAGLILGIVSVFFYTIGIIPILAIVFSSIGIYKGIIVEKGEAQALIGLVLGIIFTLMYMRAYGYLG